MIPFIKNPDNWPTDANETWWQNGYYDDNVDDVDHEEEEHDDDDNDDDDNDDDDDDDDDINDDYDDDDDGVATGNEDPSRPLWAMHAILISGGVLHKQQNWIQKGDSFKRKIWKHKVRSKDINYLSFFFSKQATKWFF